MANNVFANGREVSCKAGSGKTVACFPDVCFTPPQTPATPPGVPIPYPNTGMTSDTTKGSKKVKISGKEVMLKNQSYFKQSYGDEAGCAPKKGVITSKNRGKVYFTAWSMDVKYEGKNVVRHLDMTTHNHASSPPNTPPWPFMDSMAVADDPCAKDKKKEEEACKDKGFPPKDACAEAGLGGDKVRSGTWAEDVSKKAEAKNDAAACIRARRCKLVRYEPTQEKPDACCPSQTGDHIIPKSSFFKTSVDDGKPMPGWKNYSISAAPVMCAEGTTNTHGSHGLRHAHHKANGPGEGKVHSFDAECKLAAQGAAEVFKTSGCQQECIEAQLKEGHKGMGSGDVKHSPSGTALSKQEVQDRITKRDFTKTSAPR